MFFAKESSVMVIEDHKASEERWLAGIGLGTASAELSVLSPLLEACPIAPCATERPFGLQ